MDTSKDPDLAKAAKKDDLTEGSDRFPDHYYEYQPDGLADWHKEGSRAILLQCQNGFRLRIEALSDHILRVRYAPRGTFERDFSYALDPERQVREPLAVSFSETEEVVSFSTVAVSCRISKSDLRITITDLESGDLLSEDMAPFYARYSILNGLEEIRLEKRAGAGECYYGLGDKTCDLNLRGHQLENWSTDAYAFDKHKDPLYRAIPFYYGLVNGRGYGIFLHNTHRTTFDFAQNHPDRVTLTAGGGEMDYFFVYGPELMEVARQYHQLTGRPEMPPRWAFGFHQCRWSYYPEERVRELAAEFRRRRIPCDAIYLDIDYMDGYRCFTWNKKFFPDPARLIGDLAKDGFQTVVMIDPGIRSDDDDYHVFREGIEKGVFCRRSTGELMRGPVWPPECVFPDFTRPEVREWWGQLYRELYEEQGVSGFWNDMNEPAIFQILRKTFPDHILHAGDGEPADHRRMHNIYGQQMTRATYQGLKALRPGKRPFVLTRATFSGGQRFASVWTGDNIASWEHLRLANIQSQRLSLSGFSFVGSDIGGFVKQPSGELMVRWLQLGVFHPLFRIHSMGNNVDGGAGVDEEAIRSGEAENRLDQEPWSFGEANAELARKAIEFRYQLLPYLYTAFRQQCETGTPVLRSLVFEDQHDAETHNREREFMFGDHLLISPVQQPEAAFQNMYFPRGTWYDYWSGEACSGSTVHRLELHPDRIPVMVRAGAVVPNYPVMQYTGERPVDELRLRVYFGETESYLYEDKGEGYDYRRGDYAWYTYRTSVSGNKFSLQHQKLGHYLPVWQEYRIHLFGLPEDPKKVLIDGEPAQLSPSGEGGWELQAPASFSKITFSW